MKEIFWKGPGRFAIPLTTGSLMWSSYKRSSLRLYLFIRQNAQGKWMLTIPVALHVEILAIILAN